MKKIYIIFILLSTLLTSCDENNCDKQYNESLKQYKGTHVLRKIASNSSQKSSISGGYFLFGGSISGESKTVTNIKFCFQNNQGDYEFKTIDYNDLRVHLDSTIQNPYIVFKLSDIRFYCNADIEYVTIYCRDEDFPKNLEIKNL